MITTTYKCDKCGHEQEKADQMWKIGVSVSHLGGPRTSSIYEKPKGEQLWCRSCVEDLGLLPAPKSKSDDEPKPKPPTLEEMIREICQEEIGTHTGA